MRVLPVHNPANDRGLFVSFDATKAEWRIALSAGASAAQLSVVVNSRGTIDNLITDGFDATPTASWPRYSVKTTLGFEDRRIQSGLNNPLPCPSAVGGDFDNDMDVDIYLVCSRTITNLPNILFLNDGTGRFVLESNAGGASGSLAGSGESAVTADYDRDGFLDLFITNGKGGNPFNNGPQQLFRNIPNGNNWLEIDLVGSTSNRDAIGAIVTLVAGNKSQRKTQDGGFHRHSQNHQRMHFGLAQNRVVSELEVRWPSGKVDHFFDMPINRIIEINEAGNLNSDQDNDGILDTVDNCIDQPNPNQKNIDSDEFGDLCDEDIDGDGLPNSYENSNGLDPGNSDDATLDSDGDNLLNIDEFSVRTDPMDMDTDGDGYNDGVEVGNNTDPKDVLSAPKMNDLFEVGAVTLTNSGWVSVTLNHAYTSMVVLASLSIKKGDPPLVSRIRNARSNGFEIKVDRLDGLTEATGQLEMNYLIIEEGIYNAETHGIKAEVVKFESGITDNALSWHGETRIYAQQYDNPAVLGQVTSANDSRFSIFWSGGQYASTPPSRDYLRVGKHVGEDLVVDRASETIGYMVIESGSGLIGDRLWAAKVGNGTVRGVSDQSPYDYPISGSPIAIDSAFVASAGMKGVNGGWPILFGEEAVGNNVLRLAIDEDQISDRERNHIAEQVAYFVLGRSETTLIQIPHEAGVVTVDSQEWTIVTLSHQYDSMVVVTTPNYGGDSPPSVVRIRNATANHFEIRMDSADDLGQVVSNVPVHFLAIEEGVYKKSVHGLNLEAVKLVSSRTDGSGDWVGEHRNFSNIYSTPIVLGQVMSYNDPRFSVFWSRGTSSTEAVDQSSIWVGKHVGEDPEKQRADELVGYVVIEGGEGTISGSSIIADRSGTRVIGVGS